MSGEIPHILDSQTVAAFIGIGNQTDKDGDFSRAEMYYLKAVETSERVSGKLHGETGLVLINLAKFYRKYGHYEQAMAVEHRIDTITSLYLEDQCT
ncbi:MAG TPA: tetratricopeptide repeat protein [Candidatus Obscuribacterales bacterium]